MMKNKESYTIELREFKINLLFKNFAHNFWVLYDNQGYIVNEMHGLATDRVTHRTKPVGWPWDQIRVWTYPLVHKAPIKPNNTGFSGLYRLDQHSRTYLTAPKEEVYTRWNSALEAAKEINRLNISYWPILFFCTGGNSNSVARTLADEMNFKYARITYSDQEAKKSHNGSLFIKKR